jgi:WD40 repeat protein
MKKIFVLTGKQYIFILLVIISVLVSSCSSLKSRIPAPTPRTFPTLTSQPSRTPVPSFTPSPTITPTATPAAAAGFATPISSLHQFISIQNADQLQLLASYGKGISQQLAVSPAGSLFGIASSHGVTLYNDNSLKEIFAFDTGAFHRCLVFSPKGRWLASGTTDGNLYVWDMTEKSLIYNFQADGDPFLSLAFSPDSTILAASSMDRHIRLWSLDSGEQLNTFTAIQDPIQSLSFSPDGALLYAWAFKESIQVWRVSDGKSLPDIYIGKDNQGKYPTTGIFSADGSLFAAASDYPVRIFTTKNGRTLRLISDIQQPVTGLAFSIDGQTFAIESGSQTKIWNVENGKLIAAIELPTAFPSHQLAFTAQSDSLLTVDAAIQSWDFSAQENPAATIDQPALSGPVEYVTNFVLASSPAMDSKELYALSLDVFLSTYQLYKNEIVAPVRLQQETASAAAFASLAPIVAVGNLDGQVDTWDLSGASLVQSLMGQEGAIRSLALSSDGKLLASGSDEMQVFVWQVSDGTVLDTFTLDGVPEDLAITPDGKSLILHIPGEISIWDLSSRAKITSFPGDGITLSSDGKILAINTFQSGSARVELRSIPDGSLVSTIPARGISLAFSSDHTLLASADRPLTVWRVADGQLLATLDEMDLFGVINFTPDDRLLVLTTLDGAVRTWGIP